MEKKRRLFNGFDIAVVLLVIAAALVWIFVINGRGEVETTFSDTATYYIEITDLTEEQAAQFQVGDQLQEGTKNAALGTVADIEVKPYEIRVDDSETQSIYYQEVPDRVKVILTVETSVSETEEDVLAEGEYAIKGGNSLSFTGPGYGFTNSVILGLDREV